MVVAAWDDPGWIASELDRLAARAAHHGLGQVQQAYRAVLVARAGEIDRESVAGRVLGTGSVTDAAGATDPSRPPQPFS